jgi:hypothetical protein
MDAYAFGQYIYRNATTPLSQSIASVYRNTGPLEAVVVSAGIASQLPLAPIIYGATAIQAAKTLWDWVA